MCVYFGQSLISLFKKIAGDAEIEALLLLLEDFILYLFYPITYKTRFYVLQELTCFHSKM